MGKSSRSERLSDAAGLPLWHNEQLSAAHTNACRANNKQIGAFVSSSGESCSLFPLWVKQLTGYGENAHRALGVEGLVENLNLPESQVSF